MTQTDGKGRVEGRYFGRRLLAFLLDAVLASLIVALVFGAVRTLSGIDLGSPGITASDESICEAAPPNHPQVTRVEGMWPLAPGETRENVICGNPAGGENEVLLFTTRVTGKSGVTTYTSEASYPIDTKGKPIEVEYSIDWRPIANLLIFVAFTAGGLMTPGKKIMGVKVTTDDAANLGVLRAFAREGLKFLPFLLYFVVTVWLAVAPPAMFSNSEAVIVGMRDGTWFTSSYVTLWLAITIGTALWWIGPFVFWRGKTWYDALAGTKVIQTDKRSSARPQA